MTNIAALRANHTTGLADRVGREVVVVHVAAIALKGEVVDPLHFLGRTKRGEGHDLRLTAGEER